MWLIFLMSAIAIAFITMVLLWFVNRIYLSMQRDNRAFELENEKITEKEQNK